ncbi:MAG TPA: hypothetical protein VMX75_06800, partial [Spirochaetia bacterium]|nr:hypothetical protein [Spirochaetia bacterium]
MSDRMSRVCALGFSILVLFVLSAGAQNVTKVKVDISATKSSTECKVQYTLKNGGKELPELPISSILFQDTEIKDFTVADSSGTLNATGSASGGKFAAKIALPKAIAAEAEYTFSVAYSVGGSIKSRGSKGTLTVPILSLPFRSVIGAEPAFEVRATLPEGMGLIRTSPRVITADTSASRTVVNSSSAVLVSFFHAEFREGTVGFFTPETTAIILFFAAVAIMIALWWYYNFV